MNLSLSLGFFICAVIGYLAYFVFLFTGKKEGSELRLRNSYPFEYHMEMSMTNRVMSFVFLSLATIFMAGGFFFFFSYFSTFYGYSLAVLSGLSALAILLAHLLPFRYSYAIHLVSGIISFVTLAFSMIMTGIAGFIQDVTSFKTVILKPISVILLILGVMLLVFLINPKLKDWGKMNKGEEDGKKVYSKPKYNFFALYEWIYLGMTSLYGLILFINLLFVVF